MKLNMRESILITLLLVSLLPILGLSIFNSQIIFKDELNEHKHLLKNIQANIYHYYQLETNRLKDSTENIADILDYINFDFQTTQREELHILLGNARDATNLDFLTIVDENNQVIVRANNSLYGDTIEYIKNISVPETEPVILTRILFDKDIKQEGKELIEKTNIHTSLLTNTEEKQALDHSKGIFLIAIAPVRIVRNGNETVNEKIVAGKLFTTSILQMQQNLSTYTNLQVGIEEYTKKLPQKDYFSYKTIYTSEGKPIANIIVGYPSDKFDKIINDTITNTIAIYIVTAILVIIIAFIASKYIVKPLEILDNATKYIAKDNFDTQVKVKGPIEIEDLGNALNKMTASLYEKRRMQEDFIATLTHDMRVPLLAEQKALDLIVNDSRFELSNDQKTLIDNMVSSNQDLLKLVNTLLDTYKLEAGKYKLDLAEHDFINILKETINELQPLANDNKQSIQLIVESEKLLAIFDKSEIKRVIRNLLSNAIKFSPQNSEITVNVNSDDKNIYFSFTDQGKGMSAEEILNLFQRYASGAKKLKKVGTGLGLYLSHCIILAHNGRIWVESEVNKGSIFHVTLPLKQ
jgi:signal transduction histidine kinase